MKLARRLDRIPPYLFADTDRRLRELRARGVDVINLGIGDPDLPPPPFLIEAMQQAAAVPANHRYPSYNGLPAFREAVATWYRRRFEVELDPDREVLALIGSKEGIGHMALAFIDAGDVALVPTPGYPTYHMGTVLAGGETHYLTLSEENGFLPRLDEIPAEVARRARLLWLNYPNNPTAAVAPQEFFADVVAFAREYDVVVCHDNAYSEICYDGYRAPSFLETPGAMDVGVEFQSLSKTYNAAGWRIGMAVGNAEAIAALYKVKNNLDTGICNVIQATAAVALTADQGWLQDRNLVYQRRRDLVVDSLRRLGMRVAMPRASLYVWAAVPAGQSAPEFCRRVERSDVVDRSGLGVPDVRVEVG